jgi:hypothetical protein
MFISFICSSFDRCSNCHVYCNKNKLGLMLLEMFLQLHFGKQVHRFLLGIFLEQ